MSGMKLNQDPKQGILIPCNRYVTVCGCHKRPAHSGAEYSPHRDALSLREARSGSSAANYAAKEPAGFKGSLWGLYSAPLCAA